MSEGTLRKPSFSGHTPSLKLVRTGGSDANTSRTECSGHPEDCPLLDYWMDKVGTCRISPSALERCTYATKGWCSDTLISRRRKLEWWAGEPGSPNGKSNSSEQDLMVSTIVIEHSHLTCSNSRMMRFRQLTSMIITN